MRPDQQRVRDVVVETIRLLCRTGLHFQKNLQVQGLLGITVDDDQVFLIHVNDSVVRTIEQPGFPFGYLAAAADVSGRTAAICHTDPSGNCGCDPMQLQQQQMVLERQQQQQQQHHEVPCTVSVGIPDHHEQSVVGAAMPEVIDQSCPPNSALMYEQMDQKNTVASASETYVHCTSNDTSVQMVDEAAVAAASVSNYNPYMASEVHDNRPTIVAIPTYPGGLPQVDGSGGMITGARLDNGLPPDMAVTSVAYVMAPPPGSIIEFVPPPVSRSDSNVSVGKPAGGVVEMLQEEQVVTEEVVSTAAPQQQQQQQLPDETDLESVAAQNAANDVAVLAAAAAAAEVKTEEMPAAGAASSQVPMTFNSDDSCSESDDDEKYSDTSGSASEGHPGSGAGGALKQELILQTQMSPGALAAAGVPPGSWPVPLQRSLSDSCGDDNAWRLQASVLAGVMPPGGPHSSAYYQQQILAAAAAAAHNRAARAAAGSGPRGGNGEPSSSISVLQQQQSLQQPQVPLQTPTQPAFRHKIKQQMSSPPMGGGSGGSSGGSSHRRLPRRPRESEDKRFRCPFCELAYYHKKHLKYHLAKKHGL